ncbi:Uncharacterized protein PHSC3_001526 [Chlamydiales bacterium STE3]|nr:Uncharacterized protein PHSC3_001526 [Chlamydiales bacterium STE3]
MFTIISMILGFLLANYNDQTLVSNSTEFVMAGVGIVLFILPGFSIILSYTPLQVASQQITPRLFCLYKKDRLLLCALIGALLLPFLAILMIFLKPPYLTSLWIVFCGIGIDLLVLMLRRTLHYLDPFQVVKMLTHDTRKDIENNKVAELCDNIDAFSEMAIVSINRNSISLGNEAISELRHITTIFLDSYKSLGHVDESKELKKLGIKDTVQFILFYILQRFSMVFDHSLKNRLETVCSAIITALGKTAVSAAKYDISMAIYPIHFLSRLGQEAQTQGFQEIGVKTSLTLLEIVKAITKEFDVSYLELQPPFLSIVNTLDAIAKETFRRDKKTNIRILLQPFLDMKELFGTEKMAKHQDTPIIVQNIDRVINEFETLQSVLTAMPAMPNILPEEEKSANHPS